MDRSFETYKEFIDSLAKALGAAEDHMTDEQWRQPWRRFWSAADRANSAARQTLINDDRASAGGRCTGVSH
jgi:hypothetical protein